MKSILKTKAHNSEDEHRDSSFQFIISLIMNTFRSRISCSRDTSTLITSLYNSKTKLIACGTDTTAKDNFI